jgi:transcriptional regulator with XRE-family HTH domain
MAYIADMTSEKKTAFGGALRAAREAAGLTQAQLAERAGLHLSAITRFEQGWREPSLSTAAALAKALGIKVDDLLKPPGRKAPEKRPRGRPKKK